MLGIAWKKGSDDRDFTRNSEVEMIFLGFIVLFDPIKADANKTIAALQGLGVRLKIITGDNAIIAGNLARQIGIVDPVIVTGKQINEMSNNALLYQARHAAIFAEVAPDQKEKIVLFLKKSGNVVGFMGDGINDAPALHVADVGISVDSAVDVAKEAADIVLLNQSLEVLIQGIISGRKTFTNTLKYIFMATSANFGNMFSMAFASLLLPFLPLLPKQILLTNMLADFPEMTIAGDRVDERAIATPHKWNIKFLRRFMIVFGLLSSVFDLLTFCILLFVLKTDTVTFRTGWFVESVVSATLIVLVMRTRLPFFKSLPGKGMLLATGLVLLFVLMLPWLPIAGFLGFTPLQVIYYGYIFLIVGMYVLCAELVKSWFFRKPVNT
ncbi:HAD-IC family P-type ATPase [Chitinophaga silvisoli]|uniref:HAD-IC family P-type ATPase n=1 Tax=Chitinophaga silvisoli TaxID=2291814 RepID=UPI0018F121FC|nr:HAD-IC family P-type ATPase [Chitinophaga silvisoli]